MRGIERGVNGARRRAPGWGARILIVVASAAVAGMVVGAAGEETRLAHREGRVFMNLPENGALSVAEFEGERLGLVWPSGNGLEFCGSGGFFLRFRRGEGAAYSYAAPRDFVKTDLRAPLLASEGCEGGKRYPDRRCDDDGDGAVDEDPMDGRDNDRDGATDEDFAAIGDGMVVTRAAEPSSGLLLAQSSYAWNYGHVRDFIGFTTILELPEGKRDAQIRDVELALYTDFDIGDPDDPHRGLDDRFYFMGGPAAAAGDEEPFRLPVAVDQASARVCVAVLVLDAAGPSDSPLDIDPFICRKHERPDSLWGELAAVPAEVPGSGRGRAGAVEARIPLAGKGLSIGETVDGDRAIVHRIAAVKQLRSGGSVRIEWALVFGASRAALLRNVRRAVETYQGITDEAGKRSRWVVPARRAVRRELGMTLACAFADGRRQPAAGITLPSDLETEEVEWVRIDGTLTARHERVGSKIVVPLDRELFGRAEPFTIEGQLTDGTIFAARPSGELMRAFGMSGELPPGRLAEDQLHLFPNPFLATLSIDVSVPHASVYANSAGDESAGASSVRIYDVKGRLVRTILEEEFLHPGSYQLAWNGLDDAGGRAAPGVYYCKLQIGERSLTKRVILLR